MIQRFPARRLLNPGPVTLSTRVREALQLTDICHRDPEYAELQQDVRQRLRHVYPEAGAGCEVVLLTGSGTAAVEAMLGSLVPRQGRVLVASNGVYGERMAAMLAAQGKSYQLLRGEWPAALDPDRLRSELRATTFSHLATVHHETTTGRLNDLPSIAAVAAEAGVRLLVDTVSSFGAEELRWDEWGIDACAATANKCLHGAPGVSFVVVRREALLRSEGNATTLYLDLLRNFRAQSEGYPAFTPAIPIVAALREALDEFSEAGGWEARRGEYRRRAAAIRQGLRAKGYALLLPLNACSSSLSAFHLPRGACFEELYDQLRRQGFIIYAGQNQLYGSVFRLANMGALRDADIAELLEVFPAAPADALRPCQALPGGER